MIAWAAPAPPSAPAGGDERRRCPPRRGPIGRRDADEAGRAHEHVGRLAAEAGRRQRRTSRSASASPVAPVAALALPLLRTTAAARPPVAARWARLTSTGAALARFVVNTPAAATGRPSAVATRARSGSPLALMPHGHAGGHEARRAR